MNFQLRGLTANDLFPMFGILSKIGFNDIKKELTPDKVKELTSMFSKDGNKEDLSTFLGFNILLNAVEIITKNLPACKGDIYSLLASLSGLTVEQIGELDMVTFTEMLIAVVQKEEFKDFIKAVAKLFK